MPRNEAQTRFDLIDPALIDKRGWARADIRIEETLPPVDIVYGKGRRRRVSSHDNDLLSSRLIHGSLLPSLPPDGSPVLRSHPYSSSAPRDFETTPAAPRSAACWIFRARPPRIYPILIQTRHSSRIVRAGSR